MSDTFGYRSTSYRSESTRTPIHPLIERRQITSGLIILSEVFVGKPAWSKAHSPTPTHFCAKVPSLDQSGINGKLSDLVPKQGYPSIQHLSRISRLNRIFSFGKQNIKLRHRLAQRSSHCMSDNQISKIPASSSSSFHWFPFDLFFQPCCLH